MHKQTNLPKAHSMLRAKLTTHFTPTRHVCDMFHGANMHQRPTLLTSTNNSEYQNKIHISTHIRADIQNTLCLDKKLTPK